MMARGRPKLTKEALEQVAGAYQAAIDAGFPANPGATGKTSALEKAAEACGISRRTAQYRMQRARKAGMNVHSVPAGVVEGTWKPGDPIIDIDHPPRPELSTEDLIAQRKQRFAVVDSHRRARELVRCRINFPGPYGIMVFGDPHVDDDGTDISLLEEHARLVGENLSTVAICIGDVTNNWVGRLGHLWSEQSTTAREAWQIAEWWVRSVDPWLFMIAGNHDTWSGAGDPIEWIKRQETLYQDSECRIEVRSPDGSSIRINARHDFAGNSQWNPAHGPMKAFDLGARDHVMLCGHKHKCGYGILKDAGTGLIGHAIQVGSYKRWDRFALERGFRDQNISPAVFLVVDPRKPDTHGDKVKVFWDPHAGSEYLQAIRKLP
jgi:hypothetical protein